MYPEYYGKSVGENIFDRALALIEKGWCQRNFYQDKKGKTCPQDEAERYCLSGALLAAAQRDSVMDAQILLTIELGMDPTVWNDKFYRFKFQVVRLLKRMSIKWNTRYINNASSTLSKGVTDTE